MYMQMLSFILSTGMRRITTFRAKTDRIYDGSLIRLYYNIVIFSIVLTIAYSIQYSNTLYWFVA
jgi:hypothetical protein